MKALVYYGINDVRLENNWADPPRPPKGFVKLHVSWAGICGTDIEQYVGGGFVPIDKPHPLSGKIAPIVLGHEFSGEVVELGEGVEYLKVGQKVAAETIYGCHDCYWCNRLNYQLCQKQICYGLHDDGGIAEYVNIPAENCLVVPEGMGEDIAALTEPFAVAIRIMRQGDVRVGDTVAIVGAGAIGLCCIEAAKLVGASKIIMIAHGGKRAEMANEMGANYVLNSKEEGWKDKYNDITEGLGADVAIDVGANTDAVLLAYELTKCQGKCIVASVIDEDIPIPGLDLLIKQKIIIGINAHSHLEEFKWAFEALRDGRADLSKIITSKVYLDDSLEKGFFKVKEDRREVKILVTPHREWV